jgi:nitrite reductase/ring-hydroxylating ferredoxin subunit
MEWERIDVDLETATFPFETKLAQEPILVFRTPGGYRGVQRNCPHQHYLLTKAALLGGGTMLKCPLHNFIFRLNDGSPVNCPGHRLRTFDIKEELGQLFGRVPAETP